jgi:Uma2 family endonuclease
MSITTRPDPELEQESFYPCSDGEPMGETFLHVQAIMFLFEALWDHFRTRRPDIYIAANMFWYFEKGKPEANCSPDVMVIPEVGWAVRRSFFSWQEKRPAPAVVFEMASQNTWRDNLGEKRRLFARLGVCEYFVFDPEAKYVKPPLRGFRLKGSAYEKIAAEADGSMTSQELGLRMIPEGIMLRLIDAQTGEHVLTKDERIEKEHELAERERQRTKLERKKVREERQRLKQEKQRAQELEAELARLRAELKKRNGGKS